MQHRAAVEPVIGQDNHRMRRNHLKGRDGDRAVLAAAGYNFSLLRRWLTELYAACYGYSVATYRNRTLRKTVLRDVLHERLVWIE